MQILKSCVENIIKENEGPRNRPNQQIIHECFSNGVKDNPDIVYKTMRANHGHTYKRQFDQSTEKIDYYGQEMTYPEFLSSHGMV